MSTTYYPGCTLKTQARNFEQSLLYALAVLDVPIAEVERWNCCGTVFSLAADDLIHHVGPVRNLVRAAEAGSETLLVPCAMCYNTLKRANAKVRAEPEALDTINAFIDAEGIAYDGGVEVVHPLELLRAQIGFGALSTMIVRPLTSLAVANYYGCLLVRPTGIGIDDSESPRIMEDLCEALGATPVLFPHRTECCGSYETVDHPEIVAARTMAIVGSARQRGADVVAVSCPLCAFNLDHRQKVAVAMDPQFSGLPVLYFSQILAAALGCPEDQLGLDAHSVDPRPVLRARGILSSGSSQ